MTNLSVITLRYLAVGCVGFLICIGIAIWKWPEPVLHDEFSYLFAAKTFEQGRLANETHPFWRHFETLHILHKPSYVSKFPPVQGAFICIGYKLGDPVYGVWLSFVLSGLALFWMLSVCFDYREAFVGALIYYSNGVIALLWGATFWGGAPSMFGAALLYGAALRLGRGEQWREMHWWLFVVGMATLALSRPYEGFIAVCCAFQYIVFRRGMGSLYRHKWSIPIGIGVVVMLWGAYNYKTTGKVYRSPYMEHLAQYAMVPPLLFLPEIRDNKPSSHVELRRFQKELEAPLYYVRNTAERLIKASWAKCGGYWMAFVGFGYAIPLLCGTLFCSQIMAGRWAMVTLAIGLIATLSVTYMQFHYASVFLPLIILFIVHGWIILHKRLRFGAVVTVVIAAFCLGEKGVRGFDEWKRFSDLGVKGREEIVESLESNGGKHLVFVRYPKKYHNLHAEWVYNDPDIDRSTIVWAREINAESDAELRRYYEGRKIWILNVAPLKLSPFQ